MSFTASPGTFWVLTIEWKRHWTLHLISFCIWTGLNQSISRCLQSLHNRTAAIAWECVLTAVLPSLNLKPLKNGLNLISTEKCPVLPLNHYEADCTSLWESKKGLVPNLIDIYIRDWNILYYPYCTGEKMFIHQIWTLIQEWMWLRFFSTVQQQNRNVFEEKANIFSLRITWQSRLGCVLN